MDTSQISYIIVFVFYGCQIFHLILAGQIRSWNWCCGIWPGAKCRLLPVSHVWKYIVATRPTVAGSEIPNKSPEMVLKPTVNHGKQTYQPQLVSLPDFWLPSVSSKSIKIWKMSSKSRCWLQLFSIFHPYLGKWSNLTTVIFFKGVETQPSAS